MPANALPRGYFCFVLHSHLPYVRKAGMWPHGEEMVHEALAETYIPLLNALNDLKAEGVEPKLTIGLTPILVEQLADKSVLEHFELYLLEKLQAAREDVWRNESEGESRRQQLAQFYLNWYEDILQSFRKRYRRNIVGAFRRLLQSGNLDIITSAATHCYLPLASRDSTIYAQLKTGIEAYRKHFGRRPRGIWLPECGYRPGYVETQDHSRYKPGIEEFLADLNLMYFFTDTHVIKGGELVGKVAGDVAGPYGQMPTRKLVVKPDKRPEATERTTFRPYYVQSTNVAVYGRDASTGLQVWSAAHGYPGDYLYREFHRKDSVSGLQYWRITGADTDLGDKQLYEPAAAFGQVHMHADHFANLVHDLIKGYRAEHEDKGIIVSAYDTELFGHWWFEGVAWLKEVLRRLARSETVGLTTAYEYLVAQPPQEVLTLPESSWGLGGGHWTWLNPDTEWMWEQIRPAELKMEQIVAQQPHATGTMLEVIQQAARELLLLQSSDWPFLVTTGQAREYATGRFQHHLARFHRLVQIIESGKVSAEDERFLTTVKELDNPFPDINYRVFQDREAVASSSFRGFALSTST